VNWLGGYIDIYANYGAAIWNLAGAQWNIQCDQYLLSQNGTAVFNNAGSMTKTTTTGTTQFEAYLNNSGMVQAESGTINFNTGGSLGGTFQAAAGAAIYFSSGNFTLAGVPPFQGPGTVQITGGNMALTGTITNLTASGVTISGLSNLVGTANLTNCTVNGTKETVVGTINWVGGSFNSGTALTVASNGVLNWSGGNLNSGGSLTVLSNGVLNLLGGSSANYLYSSLTNAGTVNWQGGYIYTYASYGAVIWNLAGAQWNIQCDQVLASESGTVVFNNAGSITKSVTSGTTQFGAYLNNSGTVVAQSGTINFSDGSNLGGTFQAATGAAINFNSGNFTLAGVPPFQGPGVVQITGGNLAITGSITNFSATGVTISGLSNFIGTANLTNCSTSGPETIVGTVNWQGGTFNSTLTVASNGVLNAVNASFNGAVTTVGTLNWSGGQLNYGASLTVAANGVLDFNGNGTTYLYGVLTNAGTVNWQGGYIYTYASYGAVIWNLAGAQWNIQCDQVLASESGTVVFNNAGSITKSVTSGTTQFGAYLNNSGTVVAQSGTINFSDGSNLGGTFQAATGAAINFNSGNFTLAGTPLFQGPGMVQITGGNLAITGGISSLSASGVTISGLSNVVGTAYLTNCTTSEPETIVGAVNWQGGSFNSTLTVAGSGVLTAISVNFNGAVTDGGTMTWQGGSLGSSWSMLVKTNGVLNISGSSTLNLYGVLTNAGTVNWSGTGNIEIYNVSSWGYYGGIVNLASGVFNAQNDQTIYNWSGSTAYFNNAGLFLKWPTTNTTTVSVVFNNTGTVEAQSGTINLNAGYSLAAGLLSFGLSGPTNFGSINLSGSAQLNGSISANLEGPYAPAIGATFSVLSYGSATGQFGNVTLPILGSSKIWQIAYKTLTVTLQVVSNTGFASQITGSVTDSQGHDVTNIGVFAYTTNTATNLFFSGYTDTNGSYALNVPNGVFQVGLENLPNRGYNSVTNQVASVTNSVQTVNFVLQPYTGPLYTVSAVANPSGSGIVTGSGIYSPSSLVQLTATPVPGPLIYAFSNWSENGVVLTTNNVYEFLVNGNAVLTANFVQLSPTWTNPAAISYGTALGSNQLDASANLPGTFNYTPPAGTVLNAGTNILTAVFTPANTNYYGSATNTVSLVVLRAPLTLTASDQSMMYAGSVPALTFGYNGFVNGDTTSVLTATPTISTTGTSLSHAGNYPITVSGGAASNYNLVYVAGTLTINAAPLTITADNASKTYGQTPLLPSTAFVASGLLNGDTIAGVTLTSPGAAPTAGVGSYPIVPSAASGPRAGNYSITYSNGTQTVSSTSLTITAKNESKYFGHTLTFAGTEFTSSGLQNGETVGSVTLTSAGAVATATVAGSPYPIVPSNAMGGTFSATNYSIAYVSGSLTVNPVGPPPSITQILPAAGPTNGEATVTILGTGFESGATVDFGSLPATNVMVVNSNELMVVTPPSPSGSVNVEVLNPDGNTVTATNAYAFGVPPVITLQPASQTNDQGSTVQFQVAATGDPTLTYQWQYNGAKLLEDGHTTGTQTTTLTINSAGTGDDGYYVCVVTNLYETVPSSAAVLCVIAPPSSVTVSPPSAAVGAGGSVSFSVTASGTAPLGYSWYQNGSLLAGQNGSVLNIANAQSSASYVVVVSNAAGSVASAPVALTLLGYCASVQSSQATYPEGTNFIPLNVQTFNCGTSAPVPNAAVAVWIYTAGTSRALSVTTDNSGNGTALFTPLPTEVGLCQYAVALPGQAAPAATGSFTIIGMNLSAQSESPQLLVGMPQTNTLLLNNLTAVPLTGITATVLYGPSNVNVQVSAPTVLTGNASAQITYILDAAGTTPSEAQFSIQFTSAQGASVALPFYATMSPLTAQLSAVPASLVGTMIEGSQTLVSFTLTNSGGAASGPLQVSLPVTPWLSCVTVQPIPSLAPNQSGQIMLALTPTNGQQLGEYPGDLIIQGSNSTVTVPFAFAAVSTLVGNLQVTVQDELSIYGTGNPNLSNATVTVSDYLTGTNLGSQVTGSNGIVTFSNLTSAYYTVAVQAPDHGNFSTTLLVQGNTTTPLTAFLPLQLVDYTWTVTPTTIPDTYDFTLTTVFATEVPWPVVTVSPGSINLCDVSGGSEQVDLVITNSGLIAAEGLQLAIDNSNPDWSIVALATNLGDLAAESSIVVPITVTQIGSETNSSVPTSIAASVNWYVAATNQTEYNSTPIFIYNANPLNCEPTVGSSTPVVSSSGGGFSVSGGGSSPSQPVVSTPSYNFPPPSGADVTVTLQIDQTAVITANAFHASLSLVNNAGAQVTGLQVTINPVDGSGNPAPNAFFVQTPTLSGINAVDGTGLLGIGASAQANWTIIPTTNAAPLGTTQYAIGGSLSYMLNGEQVTIPLFAVPISVLPEPQLYLDYFLQHDVYSQDPFTSVFEEPQPFALGLRVRNVGLGEANNFTITSAQPTIINNANGLLINFQIIDSQVGTSTTPVPSLTLDMGDINPGTNTVGIWWMTSSLEGDFINFSATFQHSDALGGLETSLIQGVTIHEMNHVVRITYPSDDGIPDFLCNDTTNVDALPDNVYSSDGNVYPVTSLTGASAAGSVTNVGGSVTVSDVADIIPTGFVYYQLPDPSAGGLTLVGVKRSDGTVLFGSNFWQTPYRPHMVPPQLTNLVHIFDYNSTGSYTLTYGSSTAETAPTVITLAASDITGVSALLNASVTPNNAPATAYFQWGPTTNYGNFSSSNALTANLSSAQSVTIAVSGLVPGTTNHFQAVALNSVGTNFGNDLTLVTVPPPSITQVPSQSINVGQDFVFTNLAWAATLPVTYLLGSGPQGASITTNGVFSWQPACEEGSTTNLITVWAIDSSSPPLSNSMTFSVVVGECVQLGVGSAVMQVGQTTNVVVTLYSTVGITNLTFTLDSSPSNCFTNWTFSTTNTSIATNSVQATGSGPPRFTLGTQTGQFLISPSVLGTIQFTALPAPSAFVPLVVSNVVGTKSDGSGVGNITGFPGQVILIGEQPLLAASLTNSTPLLTIYGNPGSNYQIAFSTNLASTNWQPATNVLMTNIQQNIEVDQPAPQIYYRTQ
jgi:hypothetical protein